jgi:hypothetical protein
MNPQTQIRSPKLTVEVTQEIIDRACRNDKHRCMIAEAVKKQLPEAQRVSVDLTSIRWSDPDKGVRYLYLMPMSGQRALIQFDKGEKIGPFKFRLKSAHVTSMIVGGRDNPKRAHAFGRRKPVRTPKDIREGTTGDIIGGTRMPTNIIGKGRQYGTRTYTSLFDEPREMSEEEFRSHLKGYVSQQGTHSKRTMS